MGGGGEEGVGPLKWILFYTAADDGRYLFDGSCLFLSAVRASSFYTFERCSEVLFHVSVASFYLSLLLFLSFHFRGTRHLIGSIFLFLLLLFLSASIIRIQVQPRPGESTLNVNENSINKGRSIRSFPTRPFQRSERIDSVQSIQSVFNSVGMKPAPKPASISLEFTGHRIDYSRKPARPPAADRLRHMLHPRRQIVARKRAKVTQDSRL